MNRVALMHANGEFAEQLAAAVDQYVPGWEADEHSAVVDNQRRFEKIDRLRRISAGGCDIIQSDELVGNGPAAQALGWVEGTPVVGYLRGWGDYTNAHGQYRRWIRSKIRAKTSVLTRTMDGIASISHALIGGMSDMYPVGGMEVIERPYDVEYYAGGAPVCFDRPTILTVTNLRYREKYDGVLTILDGLEEVLAEYPDWQYAIAGDGRHLPALREEVAKRPYRDQVRVLGYRDDVPDLLASAEVFAYVSWLDGAPSTVYEAQAAGLPVIGGDAAGVPEAVGDAGLVPPPTPQGVAAAVREVVADAGLRDRLRAAATAKMATHNERVAAEWADWWGRHL